MSAEDVALFVLNKGNIALMDSMIKDGRIPHVNVTTRRILNDVKHTPITQSALQYQTTLGTLESMKWILTHETFNSINFRVSDAWAALHYAINNDYPAKVQLLLDYGSDPLIRDYKGRTTIEFARDLNLPNSHIIIAIIEKHLNK